MSRNGYFAGPFDAYQSFLKQEKGQIAVQYPECVIESDNPKAASGRAPLIKNKLTHDKNEALQAELNELLEKEAQYSQQIEEAYAQANDKKNAIETHKVMLKKAERALEEIYQYGRHVEHYHKRVRDKIEILKNKIKQASETQVFTRKAVPSTKNGIVHSLPDDYTPCQNVVEALTQFHQIPAHYIEEKLIEFCIHYTETHEKRRAWDRTFYNWVVNGWKREKHRKPITDDFKPDEAAQADLLEAGIPPDFYKNELKGFILYWQEQSAKFTPKLWQERFRQWIQRAWQRQREDEGRPKPTRPTTEEFTGASQKDRFYFNFDEDDEE